MRHLVCHLHLQCCRQNSLNLHVYIWPTKKKFSTLPGPWWIIQETSWDCWVSTATSQNYGTYSIHSSYVRIYPDLMILTTDAYRVTDDDQLCLTRLRQTSRIVLVRMVQQPQVQLFQGSSTFAGRCAVILAGGL
jgi:hypothetical protein